MTKVTLNTNFSPVSFQRSKREARMMPSKRGLLVIPYLEATCQRMEMEH